MPPVTVMPAARRRSSSCCLFWSVRSERPARPSWTCARLACCIWSMSSDMVLGWRDQLHTPMSCLPMFMSFLPVVVVRFQTGPLKLPRRGGAVVVGAYFGCLVSEVAFLHPPHGEQVDEGAEGAV